MMDAVEFFEERDRMCKSFGGDCTGCDIYKVTMSNLSCNAFIFTRPREMVAIVERWAKDHPRKTRQSELLKMFPRAGRGEDGLIVFCPEDFDSKFECPLKRGSGNDLRGECRKNYWLAEVDDDESRAD